jgi:hypothetical protein
MKQLFVLTLVLLVVAGSSAAQTTRDRFQRQRIRVSEITTAERLDIRRDLLRYERMQQRAKRDGVVTPEERRKLKRKKAENRREIFRYRHNKNRRVV